MFLHLIIAAALLSAGSQNARVAGNAVAFVHRIPADVQALRLHAQTRATRPAIDRLPHAAPPVAPQHSFTLTTQLRR